MNELNQYRLFHENLSLKVQKEFNVDLYGESLREYILKKLKRTIPIQNLFQKEKKSLNEMKINNNELISETGASVSDKEENINNDLIFEE